MEDSHDLSEYGEVHDLVLLAKKACRMNRLILDCEIFRIVVKVGSMVSDTQWIDGTPILGDRGLNMMVTVLIMEFPDYYRRGDFIQQN